MGYDKGIIYGIRDNETGEIYIGSTIAWLNKRMWDHKNDTNRCSSKPIIERNNYTAFIIEEYPCDTKQQLRAREEYHRMRQDNCVNECRAYVDPADKAEYDRKYKAEWYLKNKEDLSKDAKERYTTDEEFRQRKLEASAKRYEEVKEDPNAYRHLLDRTNQAVLKYQKTDKGKEAYQRRLDKINAEPKIECPCGAAPYNSASKWRHMNSKTHKEWSS
jgi:hypothetical protein